MHIVAYEGEWKLMYCEETDTLFWDDGHGRFESVRLERLMRVLYFDTKTRQLRYSL